MIKINEGSMKRSLILVLLFNIVSFIFAQSNKLENYRVISFGGVTRVSLVFTHKPIVNIIKETHSLRITVNIPGCLLGDVTRSFSTPDGFAKNINIYRQHQGLTIEIIADKTFDHIRQIDSQGRLYTVHIDIFRTMSPRILQEITALLDFYYYIGSVEKLNELLSQAIVSYPGEIEIINRQQNKFSNPNIYTPPSTKSSTTNNQISQNAAALTNQNRSPINITSQSQNLQLSHSPVVTQTKEIPLTNNTSAKDVLTTSKNLPEISHNTEGKYSFTLITRSDRFPTRIPQTKQFKQSLTISPTTIHEPAIELIIPDNQPPNNTLSHKEIEQVPLSSVNLVTPDDAILKTIVESSDLSEIEQLILSYYNIASVDSTLLAYLIGISANIIGDYENSIRYLVRVPVSDIHYRETIKLLYENYLQIGDISSASFYGSLLVKDTELTNEFMNVPIKLWIVIGLCALTLFFGFSAGILLFKNKKNKNDLIEDDEFEVHSQKIQRAYEAKEIFHREPEFDITPKDDYENPPIIADELSFEEEIELEKEEEPIINEREREMEEEDLDPYSDEEYRKKMILKLYNDGWKNEEIAKELQISHREIQFIIKMNS